MEFKFSGINIYSKPEVVFEFYKKRLSRSGGGFSG